MTDEHLNDELARLFPQTTTLPDWRDVRRRANLRRLSPRRLLPLVPVVAVAIVGLVVLWPSGSTFADQALAAIGKGRWIEIETSTPSPTRVIDLATGRVRAVPDRMAIVYDSVRDSGYSWTPGERDVVEGAGPEPEFTGFLSGYRAALEKGSPEIIGHLTISGRPVTVLRLGQSAHTYEEVAVDDQSHRPLWFRIATTAGVGRRIDILRIRSTGSKPRVPNPMPASAYLSSQVTTIKQVQPSSIAVKLGTSAVWLGYRYGGLTLHAAEVERVVRVRLRGFVPLGQGRGIVLRYMGPDGWLDISEETRPYAYEFFNYPGRPIAGFDAVTPIPRVGKALLSCSTCEGGNATQFHPMWEAQMKTHGLFVRIQSWSRTRVVDAAQHLELLIR